MSQGLNFYARALKLLSYSELKTVILFHGHKKKKVSVMEYEKHSFL